jgi:hypothetical protein
LFVLQQHCAGKFKIVRNGAELSSSRVLRYARTMLQRIWKAISLVMFALLSGFAMVSGRPDVSMAHGHKTTVLAPEDRHRRRRRFGF